MPPPAFDFDPEVRPSSLRPLPEPVTVPVGPSFLTIAAAVFVGGILAVWLGGLVLWHGFLGPALERVR